MTGARSATACRGGDARSLREEFVEYGLPGWSFYLVGGLKIGAAVALFAGIWVPGLVAPAAAVVAVVAVLMVGALALHVKVEDPVVRSMPALLMLVMSAAVLGLSSA